MEEETRSRAYTVGAASILSSLGSFLALGLYGRWHVTLYRLPLEGTRPPDWLSGRVVDSAKLASVILALGAMVLAIIAVSRRTGLFGILALLMALLATMTVPFIT
jgi:hypothetical protein